MAGSKQMENVPVEDRRAIFLAVVEAQDRGNPVVAARAEVAQRFGVSLELVKSIEREGLDNQWPPLC